VQKGCSANGYAHKLRLQFGDPQLRRMKRGAIAISISRRHLRVGIGSLAAALERQRAQTFVQFFVATSRIRLIHRDLEA